MEYEVIMMDEEQMMKNQKFIIQCDQILRDYHKKHGMLPSQNPDIWGRGIVAELIPLQIQADK